MNTQLISICLIIGFVTCSCSKGPSTQHKKIGVSLWIENEDFDKNYSGFLDGLSLGGYEPNENLELIVENPKGDMQKHLEILKNFKKEDVDLIFTRGTSASLATKKHARDIPLVFSIVTFPTKAGVIESSNEAYRNIAGTSNRVAIDFQYKVFSNLLSKIKTLAFIRSKTGQPNSEIQYNEFKSFLAKKNIEVLDYSADNIDSILGKLKASKDSYDAIYGSCDAIVQAGGETQLAELALELKKPSFSCNSSSIKKGFFAALVADYYEIGKEAGLMASRILSSGAKEKIFSSDISSPLLIINTQVASNLGIKIPKDFERIINISFYSPK